MDDVSNIAFSCGTTTCQSASEYCEHVVGESAPDGSLPEYFYCEKLDGCRDCACLKDAGFPGLACSCNCIIRPACVDDGGLITVDHPC